MRWKKRAEPAVTEAASVTEPPAIGALPQGLEAARAALAGGRGPLFARTPRFGEVAVGAMAVGALALGAVAIGAFAIGRLFVGKARIGETDIGRLKIGTLEVGALEGPPTQDRRELRS